MREGKEKGYEKKSIVALLFVLFYFLADRCETGSIIPNI